MSKKTLLEEGTVRRFMKLAEMEPLAGAFVNEMYTTEDAAVYQDDEGDAPVEDEFAAEEEMGEEPVEGEEEFDVEMDMEEEPVEGEEDLEGGEEAGELTLTDEEADAFLKVADKVRAAMDAAPEGYGRRRVSPRNRPPRSKKTLDKKEQVKYTILTM